MFKSRHFTIFACSVACTGLGPIYAGTSEPGAKAPVAAAEAKEESAFDKVWGLATLYSNKDNPVLQDLRFTGRLHADLYGVDADQGDASDADMRRLRMGFKATMFKDFTLHAEMDADVEDPNPFYIRLTDAYIAWEPDDVFNLKIGKQSLPFTYDGRTSSKLLLTIDRSAIGNNIWDPEEYLPGVSVSGEKNDWQYRFGIFSSGTANPEFGEFDATWIADIGIGYNFAEILGADNAVIALDYVYQEPTDVETFNRPNEHVASLNFDYQDGKVGLATDVTASTGYGGQSDLFGLMLMPSYYLIDKKLQAVLRYTFLSSADPRGIRFGRYEREVAPGRGEEYQEIYAGLNYYIYGHKLKLQGGVQYTTMEDSTNSGGDYAGWQGVVGLRMSW